MSGVLALVLVAAPLKVGVTLHPYASWAWQVTNGLPVEIVPVVPGDVDVGSYQPRPKDVETLASLDVLLENGLGHDAFLDEMVRASGNTRLVRVPLNDGTPLLVTTPGALANSHTFLSLGNAMIQSAAIARALANVRPEWRKPLEANALTYARRLRELRATAVTRLSTVKQRRVVTVHDGYSYLLQELGLELAAVVEPAHGLTPSAAELATIVRLIRSNDAHVVLSEASFPPAMSTTLEEAGAKVVVVSHIATGEFTPRRFEEEMVANLAAIVAAMTEPVTP